MMASIFADQTSDTDPVCRLTLSNKLRLCASLFSSKRLKKRYTFWPTIEQVEVDCIRRRISFVKRKRVQTLLVVTRKDSVDRTKILEEWTIGCKATRKNDNQPIIYYVSRGDVKNTIFAYKRKFPDDRIFVAGYFDNVSVVGDVNNVNNISDEEDWVTATDEESSSNTEQAESSTAAERRHAETGTQGSESKPEDPSLSS